MVRYLDLAIDVIIFLIIYGGYYFIHRIHFSRQLRAILNTDNKKYLDKLINEIKTFSGDESLSVKIRYCDKGYDAAYRRITNTLFIDPMWVLDNAKENCESICNHEIFFITIGHELGHHHYKDGMLFAYFFKKYKLISILREFRADNFAKTKCGYSNAQARNVLERKINHCQFKLNDKVINHPTWQDRMYYIGLYDTYSLDFENAVKTKYAEILGIDRNKANKITLLK